MKNLAIFLLLTFFINVNMTYAKDIIPVKHNEFGESTIALDLDSIKSCSQNTYSVEILSLANETWTLKNEIPILKYEFDINNKKFRIIESYTRNRKNWKISNIGESRTQLEENGKLNWHDIEKETSMDIIYMITYTVGSYGKKYFIENSFSK